MVTIDRIVEKKAPVDPVQPRFTRVAAYARVSTGKDAMLHSLSAQVGYYSAMIRNHRGWLYSGVYSDEARTGTKYERPGFQKLLEDCRAGKIDLIVTKSVSRFSRNTVDFLETVRELKALGVDVFFEEQNLHSISKGGELMMTLISGISQEESRSASENVKWRIRKNFEAGIPWNARILGYRLKNGVFEIEPGEAETIRRIFELYLSGMGTLKIAKTLNAEGRRTLENHLWQRNSVCVVLKNDVYTGSLTLQKTYRENHVNKRKRINRGEYAQYRVEESHEPIIPQAVFDAVQAEIARRAEERGGGRKPSESAFSGKLVCQNCGRPYWRRTVRSGHVWQCATFGTMGKSACASKQIPEETLTRACAAVLEQPDFDPDVFKDKVIRITVCNGNRLVFRLFDGSETEFIWRDRSRSESWTDEMKEAARQRTLARKGAKCQE